jgi:DNA polymerase delta subunit 2
LVGSPQLLPNILKVERSKLGYIIGTIYMEMPLKPNILEDLARDVRIRYSLPLNRQRD